MVKLLSVLLTLILFSITSSTACFAGSRYHGPAYRDYHHFRPHVKYRNYHRNHHNYYYYSDHFWTHLGLGLLTGAVIGSIFYQPPRQQTIVYKNPSPVVVQSKPVIIQQQYTPTAPQAELVLKRVRTTAELLNVRLGPGTDAIVTDQVQGGTILDVIGAAPEWLYIKTSGGNYGWIMKEYTVDAGGPVG